MKNSKDRILGIQRTKLAMAGKIESRKKKKLEKYDELMLFVSSDSFDRIIKMEIKTGSKIYMKAGEWAC